MTSAWNGRGAQNPRLILSARQACSCVSLSYREVRRRCPLNLSRICSARAGRRHGRSVDVPDSQGRASPHGQERLHRSISSSHAVHLYMFYRRARRMPFSAHRCSQAIGEARRPPGRYWHRPSRRPERRSGYTGEIGSAHGGGCRLGHRRHFPGATDGVSVALSRGPAHVAGVDDGPTGLSPVRAAD
jgi:hypothetical protein